MVRNYPPSSNDCAGQQSAHSRQASSPNFFAGPSNARKTVALEVRRLRLLDDERPAIIQRIRSNHAAEVVPQTCSRIEPNRERNLLNVEICRFEQRLSSPNARAQDPLARRRPGLLSKAAVQSPWAHGCVPGYRS